VSARGARDRICRQLHFRIRAVERCARAGAREGPGTLPACAAASRSVMRSTKSPIMKLHGSMMPGVIG